MVSGPLLLISDKTQSVKFWLSNTVSLNCNMPQSSPLLDVKLSFNANQTGHFLTFKVISNLSFSPGVDCRVSGWSDLKEWVGKGEKAQLSILNFYLMCKCHKINHCKLLFESSDKKIVGTLNESDASWIRLMRHNSWEVKWQPKQVYWDLTESIDLLL